MTFICVLARITQIYTNRPIAINLPVGIMFHTISTQVYSSMFTLTRPSIAFAVSEGLGMRLAMMFTRLSSLAYMY